MDVTRVKIPHSRFAMIKGSLGIVLLCMFALSACDKASETPATAPANTDPGVAVTAKNDVTPVQVLSSYSPEEYRIAREKITYGNATLAEVRMALTEPDVAELTNTVHAMFSMRWHRGVYKLLYKLWEKDREEYPELNWDEISREPVRIALASTLNRLQIAKAGEFKDYFRQFTDHEHEFVRSQSIVAIGFNGDPLDVAYLAQQSRDGNDYIARSAIAALGFMNNPEAKDVLVELGKEFDGTARGSIVDNILRNGYGLFRKDQQLQP